MSDTIRFEANSQQAGLRVDKSVADKLGEGYSRTYVRWLIENGHITVNGTAVKPRYILAENDIIGICLVEQQKENPEVLPEDIPIDIVHEDENIIVVNKPAGMVVHPGAGNKTGTLVNALLKHCGELPETTERTRPGIVHRLDKDTSGLLVVAKDSKSLRSLSKQFQNRTVKKNYLAIVSGCVEHDNGRVNAPLARHTVDRKKMDVCYLDGKDSLTFYNVLERYKDFTLLRLVLKTGRMHQVRVHMKHIGHPLLGDSVYGPGKHMTRHALHAELLGFTHPGLKTHVEFSAEMPEDMRLFLSAHGKK